MMVEVRVLERMPRVSYEGLAESVFGEEYIVDMYLCLMT